jgi:hypothetical protein
VTAARALGRAFRAPNGRAFLKVKDLALDGKLLYGRMIGGQ